MYHFHENFRIFYQSNTFTCFLSGLPSSIAPSVTCSMIKNHNYNVKNGVFVISSCEAHWSYSFVDKKINAIALFCNGLLFNQTCNWNDCCFFYIYFTFWNIQLQSVPFPIVSRLYLVLPVHTSLHHLYIYISCEYEQQYILLDVQETLEHPMFMDFDTCTTEQPNRTLCKNTSLP